MSTPNEIKNEIKTTLWDEIGPAVREQMVGLQRDTLEALLAIGDEYGADVLLKVIRRHVQEEHAR